MLVNYLIPAIAALGFAAGQFSFPFSISVAGIPFKSLALIFSRPCDFRADLISFHEWLTD